MAPKGLFIPGRGLDRAGLGAGRYADQETVDRLTGASQATHPFDLAEGTPMKRWWELGFYLLAFCVLAVPLLYAMDAVFCATFNPGPGAFAAATDAGWKVDSVPRHVKATEGWGGTAVVEYRFANVEKVEGEGADLLEVRLWRPFLSSQWRVAAVEKKPWAQRR